MKEKSEKFYIHITIDPAYMHTDHKKRGQQGVASIPPVHVLSKITFNISRLDLAL